MLQVIFSCAPPTDPDQIISVRVRLLCARVQRRVVDKWALMDHLLVFECIEINAAGLNILEHALLHSPVGWTM